MGRQATGDRIGILDAWRGVSVTVVVACHLIVGRYNYLVADGSFRSLNTGSPSYLDAIKAIIWRLSEKGGVFGVSVFFTISGYLITRILMQEGSARTSLRKFYVRRAARILPAFLLLFASIWFFDRIGAVRVDPAAFAYAITFTCNTTSSCGWMFGHLWTLSIEEQFYIVWPFIFVGFGNYRVPLTRVVCAVALVSSSFGVLDTYEPCGLGFSCIALGSLLSVDDRFRSMVRDIASPKVSCVCIAVFFSYAFMPHQSMVVVLYGVLLPISVFFIFVETLSEESPVGHMINNWFFRYIGLISYSVYLWQQPFTASPSLLVNAPMLKFVPLLAPVAWLSYRFVEKPFINLGHSLTRGTKYPVLTT